MPAAMTATPPCCSGAAKYLAETRNFDGTVHFIFQPAEEGDGGGRIMVEEGLFDRFPCDMVFGAHNDPSLAVGTITAVAGSVSAASDRFSIHISGHGGHAARPHRAIDPVVVGSHIVLALQSVVARRTDALDSAVLSITQFHAGSAFNVIPDEAMLGGTVRTLQPYVQDEIEKLMPQIVEATAAAHGARARVEYRRGYPPVVNAASRDRAGGAGGGQAVRRRQGDPRAAPRHGRRGFQLHGPGRARLLRAHRPGQRHARQHPGASSRL